MANELELRPLEFTEDQKTLIKRICQAEGLDDNEFALFLHICQRRRLDPILRQIYATKRNKKIKKGNVEEWVKILVPIVAIEGMTAIADRTRTYAPSEKLPQFTSDEKGNPISCTVWIKKFVQGTWHEFPFLGYFKEFVQPTDLWQKMPNHMLVKCCRAGALRMGWPEDCGGLYIEEEWAPDTSGEPISPETRKERERGAIGKLKASESENRGHGNEGIKEFAAKPPKIPLDNYTVAISQATVNNKNNKTWLECKVMGTASIWLQDSMIYGEEIIPLTTLYCWHQSMFAALMEKPQNIVLGVANKEGQKYTPVIETIMSINGKAFKPKEAEEKKAEISAIAAETVKKMGFTTAESQEPTITVSPQANRTISVLALTNAFEKIWPASDKSKRLLRNAVGQAMLKLKSKEELNDLSYSQVKIDAAIHALEEYAKMEPKASTDEGTVDDITRLFNDYLATHRAADVNEEAFV